jgi:DNA-binding LacI/PurR family transcriptional regulator
LCGNTERRRNARRCRHVDRIARHFRRRPGIGRGDEKSQAAIEQLNFRPSSIGRSLSAQSLGMIGIFASFFGAYYGTILKQTDIELRAMRRHVVVATGCGDGTPREEAIEAVKFLIGRDCDGIVVLGHDLLDEDMQMLHKMHPKMAFLNRRRRAGNLLVLPGPLPRRRTGGAHLLDAGHRQLAVISGPTGTSDNEERLRGFFDELGQGIARDAVRLIPSDFSREGGFAATQQLINEGRHFTGLFCANDEMAIGSMSASTAPASACRRTSPSSATTMTTRRILVAGPDLGAHPDAAADAERGALAAQSATAPSTKSRASSRSA